ncbi:MAG TPA: outer membrane beta-barrel protein, partial [Nitrospiria bacterium]|nr:outer membrane beta-barrel protein [Nitrospiria bacterium]
MKMAIRILTIFLFVGMLVPKSVRAEEAPAFKISGFVDAYYSYNFNNPDSRLNGGSNFDFNHNTFSLSLAELVVSKAAEPTGFRMDLDFGPTTDFVHGG